MPRRREIVVLTTALIIFFSSFVFASSNPYVVSDADHNVSIYTYGALIPPSSIDITYAGFNPNKDLSIATSSFIEVYDISHRGIEDKLFIHQNHSYRIWILLGILSLDNNNPDIVLSGMVQYSPPLHGIDVGAGAFRFANSTFTLIDTNVSVVNNRITWIFNDTVPLPIQIFSTTQMGGCDDSSCDDSGLLSSMINRMTGQIIQPGGIIYAADEAPKGAGWVATVTTPIGTWDSLPNPS